MATLEEARQQTQQAKELANLEAERNRQARESINQSLSKIQSQQAIRSMKGLAGLRQRQLAESQIGTASSNLQERERAVEQFNKDVSQVEGQIQQAEQTEKDFQDALRAFQSSDSGAVFALETNQSKEFYRQLQNDKQDSIRSTVENLKAQGVTDTATLKEIETELQRNLGTVSSSRLNLRLNQILKGSDQQFQNLNMPTVTETGEIQTLSTTTAPVLQAKAFEEPKDALEREIYRQKRTVGAIENRRFVDGVSPLQLVDAVGSSLVAKGLTFVKVNRDFGENLFRANSFLGNKFFGLNYELGEKASQTGIGSIPVRAGEALFKTTFSAGQGLREGQDRFTDVGKTLLGFTPVAIETGNRAFGNQLENVGRKVVDFSSSSNQLGFNVLANTGDVVNFGNQAFGRKADDVRDRISNTASNIADNARTVNRAGFFALAVTPEVVRRGNEEFKEVAQVPVDNIKEFSKTNREVGKNILGFTPVAVETGNRATSDLALRSGVSAFGFASQFGGLTNQGTQGASNVGQRAKEVPKTAFSLGTDLLASTSGTINKGNDLFFDAAFKSGVKAFGFSYALGGLQKQGKEAVVETSKSFVDSAGKAINKIDVGFGISGAGERFGESLYTNPIQTSIFAGADLALLAAPNKNVQFKNPFQGTTRPLAPGEEFVKKVLTTSGDEVLVGVKGQTSGYNLVEPITDAATGKELFFTKSFVQRVNPAEVIVKEPAPILKPFFANRYIEILPASTDVAATIQPAIFNAAGRLVNRPVFLSGAVEEGIVTVNRLKQAAQESFPMRNLDSIPEEQVQAFIESFERATGRPISKELAQQVFKKRKLEADFVESEKLGTIVKLEDSLGLFRPVAGTTTDKAGGSTVSNLIFKDEFKSIFQIESGVKDLNLPEVASNAERIIGVVKVMKPRTVGKPIVDVINNAGTTQKTTSPLNNQILNAVGTQQNLVAKSLPKVSPKVEIVEKAPELLNVNTQPVTGAFSGLGLYERTDSIATIAPPSQTSDNIQPSRSNFFQNNNQIPTTASTLGLTTGLGQNQIKLLNNFFRTPQGQNFLQSQSPKFRESLMEGLVTRQAQRLQTRQATKQQRTSASPRPRPRPRKGFKFDIDLPLGTSPRTKETTDNVFNTFIRRFGKDKLVGSSPTLIGAGDILEAKLKGGLGASGFVETLSGERVDPSVLGLGQGFGRSKRDSKRAIQLRGFRLGSFGERREIQGSRKNKRTKKFNLLD